jgi:hypothetical protein
MPPPDVAAYVPVTTQLAIIGADCHLKNRRRQTGW